jgi:hypothetical protein
MRACSLEIVGDGEYRVVLYVAIRERHCANLHLRPPLTRVQIAPHACVRAPVSVAPRRDYFHPVADLPPRHHRRWPGLPRLRQWTEASKHHTHKQASRAAKGLGTGVEYSSVISPRLSSNLGSATASTLIICFSRFSLKNLLPIEKDI